jgi:citrate synthase
LLLGLGIESSFFTPTFAVGRVAGWTAHCFEQRAVGRLIRPQSRYVGARPRESKTSQKSPLASADVSCDREL